MHVYLLKRLLSLIPVLVVVSIVVFLLVHLSPGDPVKAMLGQNAPPEQVTQLREELGLNRPLIEQYFSWSIDLLKGDLGNSIFLKKPVLEIFMSYLGPTISLSILAQIISIAIALPSGIWAARKKGTAMDQTIMGISLVGISMPSFLLGLLLIIVFAVQLRWFPVAGYQPLSSGFWNHLKFLILPAIALGYMQAAIITRMTRASMLEVISANYVKTAKAKGLSQSVVINKHAFRNALVTILEVIGQTFATLITGAFVVEAVFNIPGLGQLIVNSIERRDFILIQGITILVAMAYVLINLIIDLLHSVVDPRVRLK
ncbi:ABC transporter permease [Siminovitchia terrae]|uniref:ABC transporter permease n=1 Tax=Siminovitchia terrae TaxID=1914933 RepID=A0ABQ4KT73_SIMTE|nr:ABC transporter permease [Siminovitchia terrae]GIN94781.1 ABC transporter permease [Siminovitchia terrae]